MKDFDELAAGLGELPELDFMDDRGLEKRIERQINRRITKICLRTLLAVAFAAAVLLLIISPVLKRCCLDPRPLFFSSGSGDVAGYENEFTRYMRTYYETAQPYLTVDKAELKDRGFGCYTILMSVLDSSRPITIGLPPNVTMSIDWGKIKTSDPQHLTGITLRRFGDGLMSGEDKADLRQEMEALPDSSILYLSLALRKARTVGEVISAPIDVNWVEVYNEAGKIQGGLTIRKCIMGEGERERAGMTDEELKQEYLSNLQHLLAQPQLLNALGQRMMGNGGRFYSYPTAAEPVAELLAQMEAQDVLTTKNYCISGKKQEILDYLDTIDYVSVRVDQVRLSILEH